MTAQLLIWHSCPAHPWIPLNAIVIHNYLCEHSSKLQLTIRFTPSRCLDVRQDWYPMYYPEAMSGSDKPFNAIFRFLVYTRWHYLKFEISKFFWEGAHRAPSPAPSPRSFSGFAIGFGLSPQNSGASRPRCRTKPNIVTPPAFEAWRRPCSHYEILNTSLHDYFCK